MVARNEIYWADLGPPAGRRPVCILTRSAASVLTAVTCAPITSTRRGIRSEIEVDAEQGLLEPCVINCDNLITIPLTALDRSPVGRLDEAQRAELDRALRYTLDIIY